LDQHQLARRRLIEIYRRLHTGTQPAGVGNPLECKSRHQDGKHGRRCRIVCELFLHRTLGGTANGHHPMGLRPRQAQFGSIRDAPVDATGMDPLHLGAQGLGGLGIDTAGIRQGDPDRYRRRL
jgi:hypothetical protein